MKGWLFNLCIYSAVFGLMGIFAFILGVDWQK